MEQNWPDPLTFSNAANMTVADIYKAGLDHERARAEAAIARLRVAVEALTTINQHGFHGSSTCAEKALAEIGEIP